MDSMNMDELRTAYKQATDLWVQAIRAEEALATPDHSEVAWERWDEAALQNRMLRPRPGMRKSSTRMRFARRT
jgi:hypothetical protein